ncbi:MAG TPA: hypothetical protein VGN48_01315 [Pedococcus sp.]|jgi:hypothetical protein|nr:hypothetical protein [Pedococcus sp.]
MNTTRRHTRSLAALAGALTVSSMVALPAAARPDPGPKPATINSVATRQGDCPLERIGRELIRCDNLTGDGVAAPLWIRER